MPGVRSELLGTGTRPVTAEDGAVEWEQPLGVSIIEPVGGHGGMDYYDFGLCEGLAAAGAEVVLHTCDETGSPGTDTFACRRPFRHIFGAASGWMRGLRYLWGTVAALGQSVATGCQVVHFHWFNTGWLQLASIVLARLLLRRVVVTAHDVECFATTPDVPLVKRWGYRMAHRVIAHNVFSRHELVQRLGVASEQIDVIPHGNYLRSLQPLPAQETARAQLGIAATARVLLFFGQIKEVKGLDILLRALPAIVQQFPETVLLIAGKPWRTAFSHYQQMMDALHITSHCLAHVRYIHNDEVPRYYSASDLVVLPYRRIYQSGVVLMAMSLAKPVLVSDIPGMLEVVSPDETGFAFRAGDAADLAQQVCRIFADPATRARVAARGLALMQQQYDWTSIGQLTLASYRASLA